MFPVKVHQRPLVADTMSSLTTLPSAVEVQPDRKLDQLLADLSPDTLWGDRKIAAQKLGDLRCPEALQGLVDALPDDPFWMVRCAIIQALERIGDPRALATLEEVAQRDGFQVVRKYAVEAMERLT